MLIALPYRTDSVVKLLPLFPLPPLPPLLREGLMGHYWLSCAEKQLRRDHKPSKSSKVPPDSFWGPSTRGLRAAPLRGDSWALPLSLTVCFGLHPSPLTDEDHHFDQGTTKLQQSSLSARSTGGHIFLLLFFLSFSYLFFLLTPIFLSFPFYILLSNIFYTFILLYYYRRW